jgi:hypothetical protein
MPTRNVSAPGFDALMASLGFDLGLMSDVDHGYYTDGFTPGLSIIRSNRALNLKDNVVPWATLIKVNQFSCTEKAPHVPATQVTCESYN